MLKQKEEEKKNCPGLKQKMGERVEQMNTKMQLFS